VSASATPYGSRLTIWSSGAVLIDARGQPSVGDVLAFLAGAVIAFAVLGLVAQGAIGPRSSIDRRRDRVIDCALDLAAVGAAVGAVALLAEIHDWFVWPLGSAAATIVVGIVQLGLVAHGTKLG
jgi:hypothetical protein